MFSANTYINNVKSLFDGSFGVEREPSIDLSGDFAWNDLQNFLAELDEEIVEGSINLVISVLAMGLSVFYRRIDKLGILGLL